jgi:hypothetical protein
MLGNESGLERPQLGQLLDVLIPSDRIKVFDGASEKDPVLFTGFAANFNYTREHIDRSRRIARVGLGTDIFRKEKPGSWNTFAHSTALGEEVPVESISNFEYADLQEIIYTRIFLEVAADETE